jgi:hypothetical protein
MKDPLCAKSFFARLFLLAAILSSCSGPLSRDEYVRWVRDYNNGLHVTRKFSSFQFDLQYQPPQYMLLQRTADRERSQQDIEGLSDLQYYTLTVSPEEGEVDILATGDFSEQQRRRYYFSYEFQQDLVLEEEGTELPCVLFHFERPANIKGRHTFVLAFENPHKRSEQSKLVIRSRYFGDLPIKIKVAKNNLPSLAL